MACTLWYLCNKSVSDKLSPLAQIIVRHGHRLRGKPPGIARTLQQRLEELNYKDPNIHYRVDIGFPKIQEQPKSLVVTQRKQHLQKQRKNTELEKLSRNLKLDVNIDDVKIEWLKTVGPYHLKTIADHYGIFNDLFGEAYFYPRIPMNITFSKGDPVYYGNIIKPTDSKTAPEVSFESPDDSFWTLVLTNPDGHLTKQNSEYVHWFIGNIPGNNVSKGETVFEYLQPFPPKGTGYHRYIFCLYKQNKKLEFSGLKKSNVILGERTFSTLEFYRARQDEITPAGLSFFQSDWDKSLTEFFHSTLKMKEPIFEYDFLPPYHPPQRWFPLRQPFNLYMDRYRDPKQISKEFLLKKLKKLHPFKESEPELPYPNAIRFEGYVPSWRKTEIKKERLKWGRVNDV